MVRAKTSNNLPLIIIILIAFVLRFYKLGEVPASVSWDEAALGYNAYSIAQTLRDEHGTFLPLQYFASFGDYKPPVYVYTAVPFIKLFGLSAWTVRFPSALFGVLTILLTYFLTKELTRYSPRRPEQSEGSLTNANSIPLVSAFFLAVSPWHVQISRTAFEANVATFWIVLGIFLLLKAVRENPRFLVLSFICFVTSLYTFNSARLFIPILLLGALVIFFRELTKMKKWVFLAAITGLILLAPLIPHLLSKEGQLRFREVTIFSDLEIIKTSNKRIETDNNNPLSRIIHNRRVEYALYFLEHYFDHFDPDFLFIRGDVNPKFSIRDIGQLYLIDLPLLLAGFYFIFKNKNKYLALLIFWLLVAPIPAATARETPHALRSLVILPTFQVIAAIGVVFLLNAFKGKKFTFLKLQTRFNSLLFIILASLFMIQFLYFQHNYYNHYENEFSQDWQYGYKEMVPFVTKIKDQYDSIWVTSNYGRPYIFFLYYNKIPPQKFWEYKNFITKDNFGFYHVEELDKYYFGFQSNLPPQGKLLYIGLPKEIPLEASVIKKFKFLNGETSFVVAEIVK